MGSPSESNLHQSVLDRVRARIGTTLNGKWHIDSLLGVGGMAAVYAATHRTGSRVAIKMLHPQLSMDDAVRKRFSREGYVANTVGHPGVARVVDDDVTADGAAFLVMELLEGETAAARAARMGGKLAVHEVAFIGEAAAEVLAAAHAAGVIHRDVKPENVFITHEGRVVILDFGIARVLDGTGASEGGTRAGTMMGTPAFMPPEQARGRANEMDATSDVWALGATLFWLASGRVVHEAETPNEQLVAAATLPPAPLSRIAPDVPQPLAVVIDHALEFAKPNRFPDAVAMKDALHAAVLAITWSPNARPGLNANGAAIADGDETVVDVATIGKYHPLASKLPRAGLDDATTLAQQRSPLAMGGRGPTFGPVEVGSSSSRTTKFVLAGALGGGLAIVILLAAVIIHRQTQPDAQAQVAPTPTTTTTTAMSITPTPSSSATATPSASATALPLASVSAPIPIATDSTAPKILPQQTRRNWLDRRK